MPSYVQVANLAAASIGTETRLTDPSDNRTFARAVAAVWDMERRAALRDGGWNFAMRRRERNHLALRQGVLEPCADDPGSLAPGDRHDLGAG